MNDSHTKNLKLHHQITDYSSQVLVRGRQSGFTIVESIVAMAVGAILISSAIMLLISSERLSQRQRDLIAANSFVEQKVESLRSAGFLGISDGTTDISTELPTELNSPRSGSLVISTASTGLKKVDISLTYNDQGVSRTYSYTTYVGELGVGQY